MDWCGIRRGALVPGRTPFCYVSYSSEFPEGNVHLNRARTLMLDSTAWKRTTMTSPSPPNPYNVTLSSDSPTINYFPYRDGLMDGGWNMTCSQSNDSTYIPQSFCVGVASRRSTFIGASVSIDFEGTAAYLFGTGSQSSLAFQVDDQVRNDLVSGQSSTNNGLLAKVEGLSYGRHTVYLNVTQSNLVSFYEAIVTIGVGQQNSGIQNRTIVPFTQTNPDGSPTLNPQFIYTGSWLTDVPGTIGATGNAIYPRQHTHQTGAYVTFQLSQTSAFFIYGLVNVDLGPFSITLTPPPELQEPAFTGVYNSNSRYIDLDRVMFWKSGLDRDKTYSVKITNLGDGATPWWDFSHIDILDGGSDSKSAGTSTPPDSTSRPGTTTHHSSVGLIAGAAAAGVVIIALLITGFILFSKRRNRKTNVPVVSDEKLQSEAFVPPPQMVFQSPQTTTIPTRPAIYPYVPSGPNRVPGFNPAMPTASNTSLPQNPQWSGPQGDNSYTNATPSTAATPAPMSEGSSRLSYTKSGLMMSWNGEDYHHSSPGSTAQIVREEDAGTIGGGNVIRLPPDYKDAWGQNHLR